VGFLRHRHLFVGVAAVLVRGPDSRPGHAARPRRPPRPARRADRYGLLALGWRGEARHWARFENAYLLLAGLATPLVVSVHTIVSLDFAVGNTPGYHSTIFPPYFVAGALFSGFAMVLTLAIPLRAAFGLQDFITGATWPTPPRCCWRPAGWSATATCPRSSRPSTAATSTRSS
jgi:hypothetical protein